jgi:hypothetical protein
VATTNRNVPLCPPAIFSDVLTITVSPGLNGASGKKLAPRPSESPRNVPVWIPLLEPETAIGPSRVIGTPRKAI